MGEKFTNNVSENTGHNIQYFHYATSIFTAKILTADLIGCKAVLLWKMK